MILSNKDVVYEQPGPDDPYKPRAISPPRSALARLIMTVTQWQTRHNRTEFPFSRHIRVYPRMLLMDRRGPRSARVLPATWHVWPMKIELVCAHVDWDGLGWMSSLQEDRVRSIEL